MSHPFDGRWLGEYTYGEEYGIELVGVSESFEIDTRFDGDNFKGTVTDEITSRFFTEPGTVEGTFYGDYISMIKRYPCLVASDEDGNAIAIHTEPSLEIHYTGTLRKRGVTFWDF